MSAKTKVAFAWHLILTLVRPGMSHGPELAAWKRQRWPTAFSPRGSRADATCPVGLGGSIEIWPLQQEERRTDPAVPTAP